jgi:hypothetical protein
MVDMKLPSLTWYLDRIPEEVDLTHLGEALSRDSGQLYVVDTRDWERVPAKIVQRLRPLGRQGKYRVFELRPAEPQSSQVDGVEPPS